MAGNSVANAVSAKPLSTGGVWVGPRGTAMPTDTSPTLNAAFKGYGYVSDDGLTETIDRNTDKIRAWGGNTVKVVQSEYGVSYQFTLLQALDADVNKLVYGDSNVTVTAATSTAGTKQAIKLTKDTLPHKSFVFDMLDGSAKIRIAVSDGQVSEVGDITYKDDELVAYQITIECFEDANGVSAIKYLDDGVFSV